MQRYATEAVTHFLILLVDSLEIVRRSYLSDCAYEIPCPVFYMLKSHSEEGSL